MSLRIIWPLVSTPHKPRSRCNQRVKLQTEHEQTILVADMQGLTPISKPLFVVGTFADSDWKHVPQRQYTYKGNNFYQAVVQEKVGSYKMQYATELWFPQFTAKGNRMNVGELTPLTFGGYGTDTSVDIKEDGKYVWSLQFEGKGKPLHVMVNKCQ